MIWRRTTPRGEGWYWMRYANKWGGVTECPAHVFIFGRHRAVHSVAGDMFVAGPDHGGLKLRHQGVVDTSVRFGDKIPEPPARPGT